MSCSNETSSDSTNFNYRYAPLKNLTKHRCDINCLCNIPDERTNFDKYLQAEYGHPGTVKSYGQHVENKYWTKYRPDQ